MVNKKYLKTKNVTLKNQEFAVYKDTTKITESQWITRMQFMLHHTLLIHNLCDQLSSWWPERLSLLKCWSKTYICVTLCLDRGIPNEMKKVGNTWRKESPHTVVKAKFWYKYGEIRT
jgi:hypothetical protein